jgi:hypothetical protein
MFFRQHLSPDDAGQHGKRSVPRRISRGIVRLDIFDRNEIISRQVVAAHPMEFFSWPQRSLRRRIVRDDQRTHCRVRTRADVQLIFLFREHPTVEKGIVRNRSAPALLAHRYEIAEGREVQQARLRSPHSRRRRGAQSINCAKSSTEECLRSASPKPNAS